MSLIDEVQLLALRLAQAGDMTVAEMRRHSETLYTTAHALRRARAHASEIKDLHL